MKELDMPQDKDSIAIRTVIQHWRQLGGRNPARRMVQNILFLALLLGWSWQSLLPAQANDSNKNQDATSTGSKPFEYLGSFGGEVQHQAREGSLAVVAEGSCVEMLDCTNEAHPKRLARLWLEGTISGLAVYHKAGYLMVQEHGMYILDLTEAAHPMIRGRFDPPEAGGMLYSFTLTILQESLWIIGYFRHGYISLEQYDLSDRWHPKSIKLLTSTSDEDREQFQTQFDLLDAPGEVINPVYQPAWKDVSEVYPITETVVCTFRQDQLCTLDIANPNQPVLLGTLSLGQGRTVVQGRTLIVSNQEGLHCIDLSDFKQPVHAARLEPVDQFAFDTSQTLALTRKNQLEIYKLTPATNPRRIGDFVLPRDCSDLQLSGSRALMACRDLLIINLESPDHPKLEGQVRCMDSDRKDNREHDGFRAERITLGGHIVYCDSLRGVFAVDITNPHDPKVLQSNPMKTDDEFVPNTRKKSGSINIVGAWGAQRFEYDDHDEETISKSLRLWDFSNPAEPRLAYTFKGVGEEAMIFGDRMFLCGDKSGIIVLKLNAGARRKTQGLK
jgi:hypothetical protein